MRLERYIPRRRVLVATIGPALASLAGCTDDENGNGDDSDDGSEEEGGTEREEAEEETEADEGGDESGEEHGEPEGEDDLPNVEGTNLFVRVVDGEGAAIEGATVTVSGGAFDAEEFETDADGRVIEQGVEPGEYTVTASLDDEEAETEFTLGEGDDESVTLTLPVAGDEGDGGDGNESNGTAGTNSSDEEAD